MRQWTVKIGKIILLGLTPVFIQWFTPKKSHTGYIQLMKSTANTHFDVLFNLVSSHHWLKMPYFVLIKVRNYLAPHFTTGDFRIRVRGPPANYVYGSHMALVTRGSLGYSSHQKGVIQRHLVQKYASRRAPALCSMIMFWSVLSLDVSTQTVFLYYVRKIYFEGVISDVLWCSCYAQVIMLNRWNQYGFSILHRLYIWEHRWILALLLIFVD